MAPIPSKPAPRILYLHHRMVGPLARFPEAFDRARDLGFDHVLLSPLFRPGRGGDVFVPADHDGAHPGLEAGDSVHDVVEALAGLARERSLGLLLDVSPTQFALEHPFVGEAPDCFAIRREASDGPVDPRAPASPHGTAIARLGDGCGPRLTGFWAPRLRGFARAGVAGFRALRPGAASAAIWRALIEEIRAEKADALLIADTHGLPRSDAQALAGCGFDFLMSSLPWWDYQASWLLEEHQELSGVAPLIAAPEAPFGTRLADRVRDARGLRPAYVRALSVAAGTGCGILVPLGFEVAARRPMDPAHATPDDLDRARAESSLDLSDLVREANRLIAENPILGCSGHLRALTGPGAPVSAFLRTRTDPRVAGEALLVLANPDLNAPRTVEDMRLRPHMGGSFGAFRGLDGAEPFQDRLATLEPGGAVLALARRSEPVKPGIRQGKRGAALAAKWPRVVVGNLSPGVDGGEYAVKRTVGDEIVVEADAFTDGHDMIGVELQWRAVDENEWRRARMMPLGNDRFRASLFLERLGRHEYAVEAWWDRYATYSRDLAKKHDARVDTRVDLMEGRGLLEAARDRSQGDLRARLDAQIGRLDGADSAEQVAIFLDEETRAAMAEADDRPFRVRSPVQPVEAERTQARFASWYELFPRSMTDDPARHGTFLDVIPQLPRIRAMGFDVLYFTPIHPIGKKNRKGRNNSLTAGPDDPGSPYAIGAAEGGHDALHPELGTFEDFRRLRDAAMAHGMELALDFAIQCSPDHPWLKEHPGWFDYRPDGTIKYAENPPKKYEDIVNVDFYKPEAVPDLWMALRDSVMVWVKEGVRTFRVDNPHTKPLPFWEWMIGDIRREYPDVIFLSEAFTRPKVMYHLAKIGFSQSYTYFTWRNTKKELTEYLTELSTTAPKDFFRPHFFVNTPDINPTYLQSSGRAGFLVRACLAATLSGLWGVYSGYELLESEPVPGKEEYKDSEKYEIKVRDWNLPGNITPDIARLNRLRKAHPALQTHLGVTFYQAYNDNILYYGKSTPSRDDMILVAVNLNPHGAESAHFEIPLWEWGLPDHAALDVEDLIHDRHWVWHGKNQHMRLDPAEYPFAIWRVRPYGGA